MSKALKALLNLLLCIMIISGCCIHMDRFHAVTNYDRMLDSTVLIEVDGWHTGSGFVAAVSGNEALIITARHVVNRKGDYEIIFRNGSKRSVQSIRISEDSDCAVLSTSCRGLRPLKLTTKIAVGQPILVIGNPINPAYFNYVTRGIVSKLDVQEDWLSSSPVTMIDAAVNPGNSGGPVFDLRGRVIGIAIAGYTHNCGMSFITPSVDILSLLEAWKDEGPNYDARIEEAEEECPRTLEECGVAS